MTSDLATTTIQIGRQFDRVLETLLTLDIRNQLTDALTPGPNRGLKATQNELVLEAFSDRLNDADRSPYPHHLTATELQVGLALVLNRKEFLIRMAQERVRKTGRFSWIAELDGDGSAERVGMLVDQWDPWRFLISLEAIGNEMNPTRRDSKRLGLDDRAVRQALNGLENAGLLVVTRPDKIRTRLEFDLTRLADLADDLAGVIPTRMAVARQAVEEIHTKGTLATSEFAVAVRLAAVQAASHPDSTWTVKQLLAITGVSRNTWKTAVENLGVDLDRAGKVGAKENVPTFSVVGRRLPDACVSAASGDSLIKNLVSVRAEVE